MMKKIKEIDMNSSNKGNVTTIVIVLILVMMFGLIVFNVLISSKKSQVSTEQSNSKLSANKSSKCEFPIDRVSDKYDSVNCYADGLSLFEMRLEDTTGLVEGVDYYKNIFNENFYYGYINKFGKSISDKRFSYAEDFSEGFGLVAFGEDDTLFFLKKNGSFLNN